MHSMDGASGWRVSRGRPALTALIITLTATSWTACADTTDPGTSGGAAGRQLFVMPNPYNVLSVLVTFDARGFDSTRVRYWSAQEAPAFTPYAAADGVVQVPVLGLREATPYSFAVERLQGDEVTVSDTVHAVSGELPELLKTLHLSTTGGPVQGYVLTSVADTGLTSYVVAFDSAGVLRWYREFAGELPAGETKQQPNGDFTAFVGRTPGWMEFPGFYHQFKPSGEIVRSYSAPPPYFTDNHELVLTFRDTVLEAAHFFSYSLRQTDLSAFGHPEDAMVAGHQVMRILNSGAVEIVLDGWDHFGWEDRIEPPRDILWDFDHPNSISFDRDGHYIVSYRNMGEITKIHRTTGEILWRLGGRNNQFEIRGDPLGKFSAQHTARVLENGDILLFDNGTRHDPPETRVVQYRLDTVAMTADLVWEYRHDPPLYVPFTGSSQRLANGNTVVGFSNYGLVTEVDPQGAVVWEGKVERNDGIPGDFYRVTKIASLYRYEDP
jgi:hypothetical protein